MAIFHMAAKPVSRSKGRSATAASAYRSGERINDKRTGEIHDYTKKHGVVYSEIITPDGGTVNREALWNAAEAAEKRKDGTPAREYEIALPDEASAEERKRIALDFAKAIAKQEKCAVDVCIHEPNKRGDNRNHHAHLLCTTREVMPGGALGEKCAIEKSDRDRQKMGLSFRKEALVKLRETLAGIINAALERSGVSVRVDHRTLSEQGIEREATEHKGPAAVNMERRGKVAERAAIGRAENARQSEIKAVSGELAVLEKEERTEARRADGRSRLEQRRERMADAKAAVAAAAEAKAKAMEAQAHREAEQRAREATQRAMAAAEQERRRLSQGRGGFSR